MSSRLTAVFIPLLLLSLAASRHRAVVAFSVGRNDNLHESMHCKHASFIISTRTTMNRINIAPSASMKVRNTLLPSSLYSTDGTKKMTTLTEETTWRLRLLLDGVTTTKGRKLRGPSLFVLEGHFLEEEGYEPPQGFFRPIRRISDEMEQSYISSTVTANAADSEAERGMTLEIAGSRWKLSEDPNDPKDGLWVWGLFKEPLYPFLLLQMETKELVLEENGDGGVRDSLPALKLYAQVPHVRSEKVDGNVVLSTTNLNVRVLEQVKLPGATVDLFEEEVVGKISFQPLPRN